MCVVSDVEPTTEAQRRRRMPILRNELGDVLRSARLAQGKTLRDVSSVARVSLGYLSEVERGQKEASSELLASICEALDAPMSEILGEVSDRFALAEAATAMTSVPPIPDTVPEWLATHKRPPLIDTSR
jgi:transcriptional regulator with XRE-family HTH domain